MYIDNLIIEVTRFCNMNCRHCLRGEKQRKKFDITMLDNIFADVDRVGTITFTGGEPLTQVNTIIEILEYIRNNNIELSSFYIVSNGTIYSKKLMNVLNDFYYNYIEEKELCSFEISQDQFHCEKSYQREVNIWKYRELKEDGFDFIRIEERQKIYSVILEGRAKQYFTQGRESKFYNGFYSENSDYYYDNKVYVAVNGNVISECDLSYENVDKYTFGNVKHETLKSIIEKNTKEEINAIILQ